VVASDVFRQALEALADEIAEQAAAKVIERLPGSSPISPWLTASEAAEYLRFGLDRLYKLTSGGVIPHRKQEGRLLFYRQELDTWLNKHYEGPKRLSPAPMVSVPDSFQGNGRPLSTMNIG
jgi:excisionase family DNA binding protein